MVYAENPEYRSGTGNNFQARINTDSIIEILPKTTNIPHIKFNFRKINEIQQTTKNEKIGKCMYSYFVFVIKYFVFKIVSELLLKTTDCKLQIEVHFSAI